MLTSRGVTLTGFRSDLLINDLENGTSRKRTKSADDVPPQRTTALSELGHNDAVSLSVLQKAGEGSERRLPLP